MRDKEKIEAMQNVAVCVFVIGLVIAARAENEIPFLSGVLLMVIGGGVCLAGEYANDRIRRDELSEAWVEEILEKIDRL